MTEPLANHTTFRLGGPARRFVEATTEQQLIDTVADCDSRGEPVLVLGGGSNVLIADEGFDGTVVKVATRGVRAEAADCSGAQLEVAAGEVWDDLVARAVAAQWSGMETLSGIPGSVGAVPIQNVGAYGAEVATLIQRVRTWNRAEGAIRTFAAAECGFGYRDSRFKREKGRHLVLRVDFQLPLGELGQPVRYPELARALGVAVGQRAPASRVRETVLAIRRRKGMVLDANDHDTWSAGSFFTNPILTPEQAASLPAEAPRFSAGEGVKTSAAWLIQHAGFPAGHGSGPARLSTRHVLALTNRGHAATADVLALAREIRDRVRERFGITLVPEVNLVGVSI
ncbi:UDP-N-acetylmuramate dehydrogenase [Arachnia propionica]|uniref:UDP-N-acetylenolpyruvoylglucosamine reductase n=1 Tax=Arachnia propionica TaxID=1750 RepID=A0AB37I0Y8_9ACTN|nr:UDP-N-acetylmuramate dehydrogenase [Arachnia propionica]AFN47203.1 UDP-N-acetylenolpyruvoylglucosamine reductase, C-terminal domain protein [Arachnia propionica F0230a]QCT38480.1 UDP-N-acetylmuramate dehydrogenase [Arachnia propionica]QUC11926.1 UDP-N-acetylmuramate dehydrogenase [Arachnia propionica]RPA18736.1 UDP-N-acetylmuramate dehydrogenase [Arachnia propionica]